MTDTDYRVTAGGITYQIKFKHGPLIG